MGMQNKKNRTSENSRGLFDPKIDFAFKQVFGQDNPECKRILLHLLNAAFKRKNSVGIKSIEYLNPYMDKEYKEDKQSILDIKVKTEKGELIDVEIQIGSHPYFIERCLWYWSSLYERQLAENDDYSSLKRCIVISIVDFKLNALKDLKDYHGVFELVERTQHIKLTEYCELHLVQLPEVHVEGDIKDADNLTKWSIFLKDVNDVSKKDIIKELREEVPEIDMATKILEKVSQDEKKRAQYESRKRWILDNMTIVNELQRQKERAEQAEAKAEQLFIISVTALSQSGLDCEQIAKRLNTSVNNVEKILKG